MKVGVINVPTSAGPRGWTGCIRAVLAQRPTVFGINESFTRAARAVFITLAVAHGYGQYGARITPNPIFWRRRHWRKVAGQVHQLHDRLSRYTEWRGFNDARYVTELVLRRRGRRHRRALQAAVLCTHWVPEGDKVKVEDRWEARQTSIRTIRSLVLEHLAAGRVVILIGDFNLFEPVSLRVGRFRWIRGQGVDKVGIAVPEGVELTSTDYELFLAPTDHKHGVIARARWTRAA